MTLYTLDKDTADKSVCNDQCAVLWPPLLAKDGATAPANWSVITRAGFTRAAWRWSVGSLALT